MLRKISVFIRRKFRSHFKNIISRKDIEILKDKNFVIVSDNCWGGSLYQWYKRPYNSPFIGLRIYGDCYLKLLSNFDFYLKQNITFIKKSKYPDREIVYPLGLLGDIEIHFTHYKTEAEVLKKWRRRTDRMLEEINKDNYFFKMCTAVSADVKDLEKFHELPFKNKISFSSNKLDTVKSNYHIKVNQHHGKDKTKLPNGKKLFKLTFLYFDLNKWLLNKD